MYSSFCSVFYAKRLIGRKFDNAEVQSDIKHFPFKVFSKAGKPYIRVGYRGAPHTPPHRRVSTRPPRPPPHQRVKTSFHHTLPHQHVNTRIVTRSPPPPPHQRVKTTIGGLSSRYVFFSFFFFLFYELLMIFLLDHSYYNTRAPPPPLA